MRNAFVEKITKMAQEDERIILLSGDIGNTLFDDFKEHTPKQFYNCGIAEQNMIGVAAGLAMKGFKPICYTIAPFLISRPYEQIKIDVCYHNLPVILVGVGTGLSYAGNGSTHNSLEDIAILRTLPNLTILAPGDSYEVEAMLPKMMECKGPVYFRMGKAGEPKVHSQVPNFNINEPILIRNGYKPKVTLLAVGNMLPLAVEIGKSLNNENVNNEIYSVGTIKPLNEKFLASKESLIVTIEEHSKLGGYGSAVAEFLVELGKSNLLICGAEDKFLKESADQNYARYLFGLTHGNIKRRIMERLCT